MFGSSGGWNLFCLRKNYHVFGLSFAKEYNSWEAFSSVSRTSDGTTRLSDTIKAPKITCPQHRKSGWCSSLLGHGLVLILKIMCWYMNDYLFSSLSFLSMAEQATEISSSHSQQTWCLPAGHGKTLCLNSFQPHLYYTRQRKEKYWGHSHSHPQEGNQKTHQKAAKSPVSFSPWQESLNDLDMSGHKVRSEKDTLARVMDILLDISSRLEAQETGIQELKGTREEVPGRV